MSLALFVVYWHESLLVVLACETAFTTVHTVCLLHCERARVCVEIFMPIINKFPFGHSVIQSQTVWNVAQYKAGSPWRDHRQCSHHGRYVNTQRPWHHRTLPPLMSIRPPACSLATRQAGINQLTDHEDVRLLSGN